MYETLEEILNHLRENPPLCQSEEATRQAVILPILSSLGWNTYDIQEVVPEFSIENGYVDYCLKIQSKDAVFIEVKRSYEDLENPKYQKQLLEYAFRSGIGIAILTNGLLWWFYIPALSGSWEQRKFFAIDIQQQEIEQSVEHFREFLGREAVSSGSAVKRAEEVHTDKEKGRLIQVTIPRAWNLLCQQPNESLLTLFADKVESLCGHRPGAEILENYLADQTTVRDTPSLTPSASSISTLRFQSHPERGRTHQGPYTNAKASAFTFNGKKYRVDAFREILVSLCELLFKSHGQEFEQVLNLRGRKKSYFSKDLRELRDPQEIPGSGVYAEANLSANGIVERCREVLQIFGYPSEQFEVETYPSMNG